MSSQAFLEFLQKFKAFAKQKKKNRRIARHIDLASAIEPAPKEDFESVGEDVISEQIDSEI